MRIFGLAGWSGNGKTTFLVKLLPELAARGPRVSTVKHAHHALDVDKPGKDGWRHREGRRDRADGGLTADARKRFRPKSAGIVTRVCRRSLRKLRPLPS